MREARGATLREPYYSAEGVELYLGKCEEVMTEFPEHLFSAVVTDPPYELTSGNSKGGFMGKEWDGSGIAHSVPMWAEVLRICKPGAHLLSFGGTRTYHRMACAIEDAGYEIRDQIQWLYGCLSDDTELLVDGRWEPYHKAIAGKRTLCYDIDEHVFSWEPVQELLVYDYDDTAYSIRSRNTDQIVSRNHRCIAWGDGWNFVLAEEAARQSEIRIPIIQDMPSLLSAVCCDQSLSGSEKQDMFKGVSRSVTSRGKTPCEKADLGAKSNRRPVFRLRKARLATQLLPEAYQNTGLLVRMQRRASWKAVGNSRAQRSRCMDGQIPRWLQRENDWREQSCMERRSDLLSEARQLQADQIRSLSRGVPNNGSQRRLRYGASVVRRRRNRALPVAVRDSSSRQSRSARQQHGESSVVLQQQRSQAIRASWVPASDMARIEPIHYIGKVWCVRVRTGAFVARRNGKVFVTGNSGFPKALDVSKALDVMQGTPGEVITEHNSTYGINKIRKEMGYRPGDVTPGVTRAPGSETAEQWQGWKTALKPANEPIVLARTPFKGNVASNVLKYGTSALNIDATRIAINPDVDDPRLGGNGDWATDKAAQQVYEGGYAGERIASSALGRYPSNVILDESSAQLLDQQTGFSKSIDRPRVNKPSENTCMSGANLGHVSHGHNYSGGASRFYKVIEYSGEELLDFCRFRYCAKASKSERNAGLDGMPLLQKVFNGQSAGSSKEMKDVEARFTTQPTANDHPTIKPIALMRYLCRMVTPPHGIILDPFAGSGTTMIAAMLEGFPVIGVEMDEHYCEIIAKRLEYWRTQVPCKLFP